MDCLTNLQTSSINLPTTVPCQEGGGRVGRAGKEKGDKCRAEVLDKEMKETDEKGGR